MEWLFWITCSTTTRSWIPQCDSLTLNFNDFGRIWSWCSLLSISLFIWAEGWSLPFSSANSVLYVWKFFFSIIEFLLSICIFCIYHYLYNQFLISTSSWSVTYIQKSFQILGVLLGEFAQTEHTHVINTQLKKFSLSKILSCDSLSTLPPLQNCPLFNF